MRSHLAVLAAVLLSGCMDGPTFTASRAPAEVRLDRDSLTLWEGAEERLHPAVLDQHGEPFSALPAFARVAWASSHPSVAFVHEGLVTAKLPGTARIGVNVAGLKVDLPVRVRAVARELEIPGALTVFEGLAITVPARALDARGDRVADARIEWEMGDTTLATVSPDGVVSGVRRGSTTLNLTVVETGTGEALTAEIPVTVRPRATHLLVTPDTARLLPGMSTAMTVTAFDARGLELPDARFIVSSTHPGVAEVDEEHRIHAHLPGFARITVQVADNGPGSWVARNVPVLVNPTSFELRLHSAYINQGVQRPDGSVPLVAGRDGLLRVFATGSSENFFSLEAEAHLSAHGAPLATLRLPAPRPGLPRLVDEGAPLNSWNVRIPGELIVPGLEIHVEIVTEPEIPLTGGSVLRLPAGSGKMTFDVREVPPLRVRFVPIHQTRFNVTGEITPQGVPGYLDDAYGVFPLNEVSGEIRELYHTSAYDGTQTDWLAILNELRLLRIADGSSLHYYGVLRRVGSPYAGYGYFGLPVGVGTDLGGAHGIFSHELGHNFGRFHAPCGGPAGVDPNYPHTGARIGFWGFDLKEQVHHAPTQPDLMSYCASPWVSDYTYTGVLEFRGSARSAAPAPAPSPEPSLLLWGRIGRHGAVLEPAFVTEAAPLLPEGRGPYRIEGRSRTGQVLFSFAFRGDLVGHGDGDRHFAFALPTRMVDVEQLAELRLVAAGEEIRASRPASGLAAPADVRLRALGGDRVRVEWDARRHPMVMVRNPATGQVIALARGGSAEIRTRAPRLHLDASDGVGSRPLPLRSIE